MTALQYTASLVSLHKNSFLCLSRWKVTNFLILMKEQTVCGYRLNMQIIFKTAKVQIHGYSAVADLAKIG